MMNKSTIAAMSLVLAFGPLAARAQQTEAAAGNARSTFNEIRKVSTLLDADVMGRTNESVASVEDLILTPDGKPLYLVLSRGGVAGIGASYYPVPWEAFTVRHADDKWALDLPMTKEALDKAPAFQYDNYKDLNNAQWVTKVHEFFRPADAAQGGDPATATRRPLGIVLRAAKINASDIKNGAGEDLGDVEDLLMDRSDRVAFAIMGRGGVLNIGEKYLPIPWSKLRYTVNQEDSAVTTVIDLTQAQLEKAPLVDGSNYATMLGAGFIDQVYRHFGVQTQGPDDNTRPTDRP